MRCNYLVLFVLLTACSTIKQYDVPVEERGRGDDTAENRKIESTKSREEIDVEVPVESRTTTSGAATVWEKSDNPAVLAFLSDAEKNSASGKTDNAAASLERALNLEPKNSYLWHKLAMVRLQQKNWQQAYVLANKSNSLARGNTHLQKMNWRIIADAKQAQGETSAARKAEQEIKRLQ